MLNSTKGMEKRNVTRETKVERSLPANPNRAIRERCGRARRSACEAQAQLSFSSYPRCQPDQCLRAAGGHVFIGQGLLDQMTSEDELAFVLGHELEHIDHYHAIERVQIEAKLKSLNLDIVSDMAEIPISLWQAGYSKDQEFEANREGLRIASAAGYSPQGAVMMTERLGKLQREYVIHAETPTDELSQVAIDGLTGYFRSHPLPSERLEQVNTVIAEDHLAKDQSLKPLHIEYEVTSGER